MIQATFNQILSIASTGNIEQPNHLHDVAFYSNSDCQGCMTDNSACQTACAGASQQCC